jgi:polyisoprenoid-binding protein YceI
MAVLEQQIPAATWQVDPVHSTVGFGVKHMVSTFKGTFDDYEVTLVTADGEDPKLTGVVKVASVQTRVPDISGHLQTPDFFDAEANPELRFESREFRVDGDDLVVAGDLTLRGVTKPVEGRGKFSLVEADMAGGQRIGVELETVIDRTEYGINWNADLPKGGKALENDVAITIHVELTPAA